MTWGIYLPQDGNFEKGGKVFIKVFLIPKKRGAGFVRFQAEILKPRAGAPPFPVTARRHDKTDPAGKGKFPFQQGP